MDNLLNVNYDVKVNYQTLSKEYDDYREEFLDTPRGISINDFIDWLLDRFEESGDYETLIAFDKNREQIIKEIKNQRKERKVAFEYEIKHWFNLAIRWSQYCENTPNPSFDDFYNKQFNKYRDMILNMKYVDDILLTKYLLWDHNYEAIKHEIEIIQED